MREIWSRLEAWVEAGRPFALATVLSVRGSGPRVPGACMAIAVDGPELIGSVSSGCLDVELVGRARGVLESDAPVDLEFRDSGQPDWLQALTCGGEVAVRLEPWWGCSKNPDRVALAVRVAAWLCSNEEGVVVSEGPHSFALDSRGDAVGEVGAFDQAVMVQAAEALAGELPPFERIDSGQRLFFRTLRRRPRLLIVGGVDVAWHLVVLAQQVGFVCIVVEPRSAMLAADGLPMVAGGFFRAWPRAVIEETALGPRDAAVVLTHDPKIDDQALLGLLRTRVGYIGALGSRRSHAARLARLRREVDREEMLARIEGPAGIHLGAGDAGGIAVGILAGIIAWQATEEKKRRLAADGAVGSR